MSRVLVLGSAPLLFESAVRTYAAGARTWQLTEPLINDGHDVMLIGQRLPKSYAEGCDPDFVVTSSRGFVYRSVEPSIFQSVGFLSQVCRDFHPDAVVFPHASASFGSHYFAPHLPTWIDINGHIMTEAQAKAAVDGADTHLNHFFRMELDLLVHGDVFSTVCVPQTWAVLGELGLVGRMNASTVGYPFVETIPVGVSPEPYRATDRAFRGLDVPSDSFVVLWSGGYNTWTDVETMFAGLEFAMERDPSIRFVSTGGRIDGHDEKTYPKFQALVAGSRFRTRYHLRGWLPREEVPNYYLEANLGINCEKPILEVAFGSKQRILDWSRANLPCVTTRLTELSEVIEREHVGFVVEPCRPTMLGRAILNAARNRARVTELGVECRQRMIDLFSYPTSTLPLRKWVERPTTAPDRNRGLNCVESMLDEVRSLRTIRRELEGRCDDLQATVCGNRGSWSSEDDRESLLSWTGRVVATSYRQGGLGLVAKRTLTRLRGRSATI